MFNKKAQVSDTIMWVVATVIIITILIISVFISSTKIGGNKEIVPTKTTDTLATKTLYAYLLTKQNSETNYNYLKDNSLDKTRGEFAKKVFSLYEKDYYDIWFGLAGITSIYNSYFGARPDVKAGVFFIGTIFSPKEISSFLSMPLTALTVEASYIYKKIKLDEDSSAELILKQSIMGVLEDDE